MEYLHENFYWTMSIIILILLIMALKIGYVAGKGRIFQKCKCKRPLPYYEDILLCQECDKQIDE